MNLSELLREIGDENTQFQVLNHDMTRASISTRGAEIVFSTASENVLAIQNGTKRALIVWLDEGQAQAAAARLRAQGK